MEEYLVIMGRTVLLYVIILLIFRLMGKREIGELSLLDLIVSMMIAEMAVIAIESPKDPILHSVIPMGLLMVIQYSLALLSLKSKRVREIIDGKPTVIINRGKIDEDAMRKQRYNLDDLLMQLREKDVKNLADVEFAILESSGDLSVLTKNQNQASQSTDYSIDLPLILDGQIQDEHLNQINKTEFWLRSEMKKLGHTDIKKISYCSYHHGKLHVDIKDEKR
ncbi:DUF421 domain-containing protein [Fredinandcohnia sp. QZ13]|uniref:DUF421 domain-containing protein n=1 Tax=Fredinandcohnia sp. QZ13 TaxID=3073144 RepID=UPI002852F989|nr:DUF421 domain-containing protein [Fredinandcohnia sp. QZ13]MDR4889079.1 DUF421 domain-containing protein [Fredinandcohnia sp. QZ13]